MNDPAVAAGAATLSLKRKDFESDQAVRWCPGCGDYSVLSQTQKVMPDLGVPRENVVFISGIGCSSRFPYYMNTYGFHTIHGRAPAIATGLKLARPELSVWVITGDGDGLSIGGNHLIHTMRRNIDLNIMLFNNEVYGLTKGQFSPTSRRGMKTKSSPLGSIARPFSTLALALGAGATFVARTIDTDAKHLQAMLKRMAGHKGTSFLEILQNCPVFNDGIYEPLKDRKIRSEHVLELGDGEPLVYGADLDRVIKLDPKGMRLYPGRIGEEDGGVAVTHDEHAPEPTLAMLLASLPAEDCPKPIGVFRAEQQPTFDDLVQEQAALECETKGVGTLETLLHTGDLWEVSEGQV
jgi:2-oxoglutarate ferredoxin oxidoreductase subunit beta